MNLDIDVDPPTMWAEQDPETWEWHVGVTEWVGGRDARWIESGSSPTAEIDVIRPERGPLCRCNRQVHDMLWG